MHEGIPGEGGPTAAAGGAGGGATPSGGGHRRGGRQGPRSRGLRIVRWVAGITAVAVLGTAGAAFGYYEYLAGKIREGERVSGDTHAVKPKADAAGKTPMNILVLGSDSRADAADRKLGGAADSAGARADVIMIIHLSADRTNMSVVSIPRDTRVDIPRCTDSTTGTVYAPVNTIVNASLGRGGPGCTLATVQNLTGGVYIDHWLEIDFAGVVKMAGSVGGVPVCVNENVWDRPTRAIPHGGSGLKLTKGTHVLDPRQSLQWLRTRDAWGDDSGRARAQHMYMSSLIRQLREQNLFADPSRLNGIAVTAMSAFRVSSEIATPKKLYDLGMQLKTIPPNRITMLTMPHIPDPQDPNAHYLPDPATAPTVWSLLRDDVAMDADGKAKPTASGKPATTRPAGPPASDPATVPVSVINGTAGAHGGTTTDHRATAVSTALVSAGFAKSAPSPRATGSDTTTVAYPRSGGARTRSDALSVAKALKIPAADVKASSTVDTITLTVGADWKDGTDYSTTLPKAGSVPSTADVYNGTESRCMDVQPVYRW